MRYHRTTISDVYEIIYSLFIEKVEISPVYMTISKTLNHPKKFLIDMKYLQRKTLDFP